MLQPRAALLSCERRAPLFVMGLGKKRALLREREAWRSDALEASAANAHGWGGGDANADAPESAFLPGVPANASMMPKAALSGMAPATTSWLPGERASWAPAATGSLPPPPASWAPPPPSSWVPPAPASWAPPALASQAPDAAAFAVAQRHEAYTEAEHETWRRLLARSSDVIARLGVRLHPAYIAGLERLVLPWSRIPCLDVLSASLAEYGWRTLCVSGYLPSEVYAGLMAHGVFPVARDIRREQHLDFSPTPDLAHDLIGHVPMLISSEHRRFLQRLSWCLANTPPSDLDRALYLAQRRLGAARAAGPAGAARAAAAERRVAAAERALAERPSRLCQLGRLYLWSIEFGLMGTCDEFAIYGAGLLSSPAETDALCSGRARVVPLSPAVFRTSIHFSDPQDLYFVARDYEELHDLLDELQADEASPH
jgi:phenylalanine-4-hydroxylase